MEGSIEKIIGSVSSGKLKSTQETSESVILTIENNQFKLTFPYSEFLVIKARQIPGSRWSKRHRAWFFPLSVYVYSAIKANFDGISPDDKTMDFLIKELTPKPIKIVESKTKLYDHQREAVRFVLGQLGFEVGK